MTNILRAALTQTVNAYEDMPATVEGLRQLQGKLEDVRRANVEHHVTLIERAADNGAKLIGLGELFAAPYFALTRDPMWRGLAEDAITGPTVMTLRETARLRNVVIVAPIYELDSRTGKRFNTAVVIDAAGEVIGRYRKVHIPAGSNEQGEFQETAYYEGSDGDLGNWPKNLSKNRFFPVFDTGVVRLGIAICYDRHFEGVVRTLAQNGAELILSPAVTFGAKSRRMWDLEFAVDAARHNVFIGGSNRLGSEPPWNQPYFGESHFAGPHEPPRSVVHEGFVCADLDLDLLRGGDPSGWDLARDWRDEVY